jgi:TPR repeat protein
MTDDFGFTMEVSYWGTQPHDFDRPGAMPGSLLSRVRNDMTGDVFVILTAQEVDEEPRAGFRDYWTSVVLCAVERPGFLRQRMKVYQMRVLEITRNNMTDAHSVHHLLKDIVKNEDPRRLKEYAPDPVPPEGLSADALRVLAAKGITGERPVAETEVRARWGYTNPLEGLKTYEIEAERGIALSQYNLGWRLANGQGVNKDLVAAIKWYRKAAEQGLAQAQFALAWCYYQGEGVPRNHAEAVNFFRKAAKQGHAVAQNNLGWCYYQGEGIEKDLIEAVRWTRKAAEQGQPNAQDLLGTCYSMGNGVIKDYVEAYKWFNLAAAQGEKDAKEHLSEVEKNMTPEQIADAQRLSVGFVPQASSSGRFET